MSSTPPEFDTDKAHSTLRRIPLHMQHAVIAYVKEGREVGDFLRAVITNNLKEACIRADDINKFALFHYVDFFYNFTPTRCWGSLDSYEYWVKHGGLLGLHPKGKT